MTTIPEEHLAMLSPGPPYELATAPITCPHCIAKVRETRSALCEQYGWNEWPEALNKGRDYVPMEG